MDAGGYWGILYLKVVLCCVVMDGRNGNEMAMFDVYDVEGESSRCLGTENRIGILGKALGGPTVGLVAPRLQGRTISSSHTFNSVTTVTTAVVLKRQAKDGDCEFFDWSNSLKCPGVAILQPPERSANIPVAFQPSFTSKLLRHGMVPRWD